MSVPSVTIAKDRLRNLLITDRIQCTPDMIEFLTRIYIRRFLNT